MLRMLSGLLLLGLSFAPRVGAQATEGEYLYDVRMVRAAPGQWLELMDLIREAAELHQEAGDGAPFWMRHSQGDQWDFMLLLPMEDHAVYHAPARIQRRARVWESDRGRNLLARMEAATSYTEDWFARSVPADEMRRRFQGMALFHIEMFAGLPVRRGDLVEQRRMENRFYGELGAQQNLIFVRDSGPNWDAMTLGLHRDLQAFAEPIGTPAEEEAAARAAGFDGVGGISPLLRSLLSYHHDTLAVAVR